MFSRWLVVNMKSLATPLPRQSYQSTGANEATRERKTWNQNEQILGREETVQKMDSKLEVFSSNEGWKMATHQYEKRAMKGKEVMQARLNQELKR